MALCSQQNANSSVCTVWLRLSRRARLTLSGSDSLHNLRDDMSRATLIGHTVHIHSSTCKCCASVCGMPCVHSNGTYMWDRRKNKYADVSPVFSLLHHPCYFPPDVFSTAGINVRKIPPILQYPWAIPPLALLHSSKSSHHITGLKSWAVMEDFVGSLETSLCVCSMTTYIDNKIILNTNIHI